MSVPTYIQSTAVPLTMSLDDITYKNVVCKKSFNANFDIAVNKDETDCGVVKGLGAIDWKVDFEGVVNTTPNTPTELSAKALLDIFMSKALVYLKTMTGAGSGQNVYLQGSGYVTNLVLSNAVNNVMGFTFTFEGVGDPDVSL